MIYALSFAVYILYQQINLARNSSLIISSTEINITQYSILNFLKIKFVTSKNDQKNHDRKNINNHHQICKTNFA